MSSREKLDPLRVLILGGSSEASALAQALAGRTDVAARLSLAGRVREPAPQPLPTRVGGFGGAEGLAAYLQAERIAMLVDATHPFAARMSANARAAAESAGVALVAIDRGPWRPEQGDRWHEADTIAAAATALGPTPRRVFLTIGRLSLGAFAGAPQHHYLVRSIEPVGGDHGLADATFVTARGPFTIAAETALLRAHRIDVLVTKNSGGTASYAKIAAARTLGLSVVLVRQPGAGPGVGVAGALEAIRARLGEDGRDHAAVPARLGV